jgi:hypothetical protein
MNFFFFTDNSFNSKLKINGEFGCALGFVGKLSLSRILKKVILENFRPHFFVIGNSIKFFKMVFWKGKLVGKLVCTLGNSIGYTSLFMKEGCLFILFVTLKFSNPQHFLSHSWCHWKALGE